MRHITLSAYLRVRENWRTCGSQERDQFRCFKNDAVRSTNQFGRTTALVSLRSERGGTPRLHIGGSAGLHPQVWRQRIQRPGAAFGEQAAKTLLDGRVFRLGLQFCLARAPVLSHQLRLTHRHTCLICAFHWQRPAMAANQKGSKTATFCTGPK